MTLVDALRGFSIARDDHPAPLANEQVVAPKVFLPASGIGSVFQDQFSLLSDEAFPIDLLLLPDPALHNNISEVYNIGGRSSILLK